MAISASSYAVGNRLYKGATSAPTQGRVDPTGYIDRELNKVADSRSGIAASALRRMSAGAPNADGSVTYSQSSSGQVKGLGIGATPTGPQVKVSPIGKLEAPVLRDTSRAGLPFDAEAADAQEALLKQKNTFDSDLSRGRQQLERQYVESSRGLDREQPQNQREVINNYSGRGLAYSSGYADDFGSLEAQYANMRSALGQQKTEGLTDLDRQQGNFNDEYGVNLTNIQRSAARKAAEKAAELEFENQRAQREFEDAQAAEQARFDEESAAAAAINGQITTNPNIPYDNRYNAPTFNPNPNNPVVGAPSLGGGVANGPGRNLSPNPIASPTATYTAGPPITSQPTAAAPTAPKTVDLSAGPGGTRTMASFDTKSRTILTNGGTVVGGNGYTYKYDPNTSQVVRVK